MDNIFSKLLLDKNNSNNNLNYEESNSLNVIIILAIGLFLFCDILFILKSADNFLILVQTLCLFAAILLFFINRLKRFPHVAIVTLSLIFSILINVWSFKLSIGDELRWFAILWLYPLYSFSTGLKLRHKVFLSLLIGLSFLSATFMRYYHEPTIVIRHSDSWQITFAIVVVAVIILELIIYKRANVRTTNELVRIGNILENIECGIVIVDAETRRILEINNVALEMFGGTKDKIVGNVCQKHICPAVQCPVLELNQIVDRSERKFIRANGEIISIIKSVAKIQYNGRLALLETFADISNIKEAEEKLRRLEVTEQANLAKSEFLSRMSHEMRTPMNAIIGMTKIAEGTDDVEKLRYCLSTIGVSSAHLLGIINNILDMSKIEAGKFELDNIKFNLEKVLSKVCNLTAEQMEQKNIKLNIVQDGDISKHYIGDELRLSQVIINLLSNAVKFTPEGGNISITVNEIQKETNYSILRFGITDTGIGMSQEQIGKLFNAFEQADGSITRKFGGTGLGLAISKSIVEMMGGRIWVESELNNGSEFIFEIKLERQSQQAEIIKLKNSKKDGPLDFSNIKILLVEDVRINREIFISLLKSTEIKIDTAENGVEAVQKFKDNPDLYDMIIMDIQMPLMDGYEATQTIRSIGTDRALNTPIIAMSANVFKEDIERCIESGMNDHLAKPIDVDSVIEKISLYSGVLSQ